MQSQNRRPTLHTSMSRRSNPGLSRKTTTAKRKEDHSTQRSLFAELSEGLKALADARLASERSELTEFVK